MTVLSDKPVETELTPEAQAWNGVVDDIKKLVTIQTWRSGSNEQAVQDALTSIKKHFDDKVGEFNQSDNPHKISKDEWNTKDGDKVYRVFRYIAGSEDKEKRKISIICHLDTVPPGNDEWRPFAPRVETRVYKGVPTEFLIGRGSIDDKGPAVVAFDALINALNAAKDQKTALDNLTLEVMFDTSEETNMSTPVYFKNYPDKIPTMGIVFDAFWSVRAEKGVERPIFSINSSDVPDSKSPDLWIADLKTSSGSVNMIPVTASATIKGSLHLLELFAKHVDAWYRACTFDDPNYHPADIEITEGHDLVITAKVAGAQHGSAPHQNRANGANPVVSLTNFLATLIDRGILANNQYGEMCRFIRWAFGTKVFGENQADLLSRYDSIFEEGNGTTYALTQLTTSNNGSTVNLGLDIRYAIGHHERGWDGSEGVIKDEKGEIVGKSLFAQIFKQLVKRYKSEYAGGNVTFTTVTLDGPDIRSPRNQYLFRMNTAYRAVMGENCPMQAIGGGTDAHGYPTLVTAGALFTDDLGPPINYHGLDEGAPLIDLKNSGKILLNVLLQELAIPTQSPKLHYEGVHHCCGCCN